MESGKKVLFITVSIAVLIILACGVTLAFFNYTRTGAANTVGTGRIFFDAEQSDTVTLSDLFPITTTGTVTSSTPGVGSLSIHVTGDTNYSEGLEYIVKAVNVTNSSNGVEVPISIAISYEANGTGKTIGTEDTNYFTNRGGNSSIYKVLSTNSITDDGDLVVGYIAPGETGIDGYITIIAYLDAGNIAITDTYNGPSSTPDANNGTAGEWVDNRTVLTTTEWNELSSNGMSFQIKVEAAEGTWVTAP